MQSVRLDCIHSMRRGGLGRCCGGSGWSVGFGRRLLGRRSLVRLASGPSSLGSFGSSSCCFGLHVLSLRRHPSGRGRCLGDGGRWWSCTLRCWGGWAAGW
jgi:hypothetical protein